MNTKRHSFLFTHIILWSSVVFMIIALIWSKLAILDEVTSGQGKVIPSSQVQVIQNLEGGIVSKLFIKEGDIVNKNQVLMQIDDVRFMSSYKEDLKKMTNLQLEIIRLTAEVQGTPLNFPQRYITENPDMVKAEEALYKSHTDQQEQLQQQLELATKELNLTKPLIAKGAVSEVEVIKLERDINEIEGNIEKFKSSILESLNKAQGELSALTEANLANKDRLTRTTVRSPVKGIVKQIKATTLGGVIQPGSDILEIVPLDDTLLIEANIRPGDISFIHPGQKAMVKITAHDFSIYGGLPGIVEQISADTIPDEKKDQYYIIRVRTDRNYLGTTAKPLPIIPGMLATVDILTGKKSVLDYILNPILKAEQNALRER